MKPDYELSEVKSFVDSYDHNAVVGLSFSMGSGPSRKDQHSRTSYVYAWCDPLNHVFYIGKGGGNHSVANSVPNTQPPSSVTQVRPSDLCESKSGGEPLRPTP